MNRRGFLRMLGFAPVAAVAAALPAAAHAFSTNVEYFEDVYPDGWPTFKAILDTNMRTFEEAVGVIEQRATDDLRGPVFDNADDLIADLHSD